MADISIEEAKAQQWILDVKNELASVEMILKKVSTACATVPGEDDDIMKGIVSTAETLRGFWDQMCSGFQSATKLIQEAISKIGTTAGEVVDDINNVKSRIGS